jgi:hypothetical protein
MSKPKFKHDYEMNVNSKCSLYYESIVKIAKEKGFLY